MFHYVKPYSNYYHYNLEHFERTIKYLMENYKIISLKQFDEMIKNNKMVSDEFVMLTFDDGTIDHYKYVYPILNKYNCSALFFVSSCIFNNNILDIQIIHQLLANYSIDVLLDDLMVELKNSNIDVSKLDIILDGDAISLFKQLLQYKLPNHIRKEILHYFSIKYNISLNVEDNYIGLDELKEMKANNMFFGIHTNTHPRLGLLTKEEQRKEIKENKDLLINNGLMKGELCSIAFPFGSYNDETIDIMREEKIKYGFKVNEKGIESNFLISRIDCNFLKDIIK